MKHNKMKDEQMTKEQLINELSVLRQRISESEEIVKTDHNGAKEALQKNFSIIGTATRSVHESINLQEFLENAVKSMHKNIKETDYISIYLVEGKELVVKANKGYPDWFIERVARIPYLRGAIWKTIMEGKPRCVTDAEKETIVSHAVDELGTKSYLSMPIYFEGKAVGCININSRKKNIFGKENMKLLEIVSQQIEVAINNTKQAEALRQSEES